MPATPVHQISPYQPDEDFINKSLLASLDAQADAEPTSNADDADQHIQASHPPTSNSSSSGSPNVNFPMSHQIHLPRTDSPSDAHKQQMQMLRTQESFYNHPPGLYTGSETFHRQPEFSDEYDAFPNNYRNAFTSYPNTTRSRQQANINTPYRDPAQYFPSPGAEMYGTPTSQPLLQPGYDSRPPYDYTNGHSGGPHKSYPGEQFNVAPSLLHAQGKQPQPSLSNYSSSVPSNNSVQLSSQTPFGPHVPAGLSLGNTSIVVNGNVAPNVTGHGVGVNNSTGGEEISTIFVVGFPEDMQEREFVNMFTFSEGFEAATLKIPNKEYPQYPPAVGAPPSANGLRGLAFTPYGAPSDPYNINGVDGGRDGLLGAAWHGSDERASGQQHFLAAGGLGGMNVAGMIGSNSTSVPPRKQIIGFAKFKTRQDALVARDQLQGKRVDIEKGAVLKAEMAKKNLHTKRGVGSVPVPPIVTGAGVGLLQNSGPQPVLNGLDSFTSELKARDAARLGGWRDSITLQTTSQQSNDLVNGSTSLGNFCNVPVSREEEEDRRRESLVTALGGMSLAGSSSTPTLRGPRDEERIKESQREKELNLLKLRASNAVAFDAFHSVGVNVNAPSSGSVSGAATPSSVFSSGVGSSIMSRQTSAGQCTNSAPNSALLPPSSTTQSSVPTDGGFGAGSPMISGAEFSQQKKKEEVVGPWDNLNLGVPIGLQAISRPRSQTQGSSSPILSQASDAATTTQNGMNALGYIGSLLNGSIGLGSNINGNTEHPRLVNGVGGLVSSSSTGSNGSTGNVSPTLPSPASGMSHGSNSSCSSSSSGASGCTTGTTRGSVDQNPPISTLYVGNLPTSPPPVGYPADYLEETLKEIFSQQRGYRQLSFRQKPAGPMCFVEFETVQHAAQAKQDLSGNTLGGLVKNGIRLSYSKNPLGVRGSTHVANGSQHHQPQSFSQSFSPHSASFQQQHHGGDLQARLPDEYIGGGGGQHHQQHHRGGAPHLPLILRRGESMMSSQGPPLHHQSFGVGTGNTTNNPNTFLSSPPPRFYSTSPGGVSFASTLSTPLTSSSSAFVPRSMAATAGGSGGVTAGNPHHNGVFAGSPPNLSPYGVSFASSESAFHHSVPAAIPSEQQSLSDS